MTDDLVKRLRDAECTAGCGSMKVCVCAYALDAADRIEELEKERDEAFARGVNFAQNEARLEGRFIIVDSPEINKRVEAERDMVWNEAIEAAREAVMLDALNKHANWSTAERAIRSLAKDVE